jgi:hypothetical protein
MATQLFSSSNADLWWPVLHPNGDMFAAGGGGGFGLPPRVSLYRLGQGLRLIGFGRLGRFVDPASLTFLRNVTDDKNDQRTYRFVVPLATLPPLDPRTGLPLVDPPFTSNDAIAAANDFDADGPVWCGWLDREFSTGRAGRLVVNDNIVGYGYGGVSTKNGWIAVKNPAAGKIEVWKKDGSARYKVDIPAEFNRFRVSSEGWVGFGYWGTPWIIAPNGAVVPIPHGWGWPEGVPVLSHLPNGEVWAWTHTIRPEDGHSFIFGRHLQFPVVPKQVGRVIDYGASWLDVVHVDGQHRLVGSNDSGQAQLWSVPDAEDLQGLPVTQIITPPTATKPTITIKPGNFRAIGGLKWEATATTTGEISDIRWRWRRVGDASWSYKHDDQHTTVDVPKAGRYEIGVDCWGPGGTDGTATPRYVEVI